MQESEFNRRDEWFVTFVLGLVCVLCGAAVVAAIMSGVLR